MKKEKHTLCFFFDFFYLVYDDGEITKEKRIRRKFFPFSFSFPLFFFFFLLLVCEKRIEMNINKTRKLN